jgi:WXG100 family type VII secretion target
MATTAGSDFQVTPEEITAAANAADNVAGEINDELAVIKNYVMTLEAEWRGIASNTFQSLMTDYAVFSQMLNQSLTDIASGLRGNYVNYTASEEANIGNLKTVNGAIPGANFA